MQRLILTLLSTVMLVQFATPSLAKEIAIVNTGWSGQTTYITPFNLVNQAYRGYFDQQGIPSYNAFANAVIMGRVDEVTLIEAAIANNRLNPETLEDQSYRHSVRAFLRTVNHH